MTHWLVMLLQTVLALAEGSPISIAPTMATTAMNVACSPRAIMIASFGGTLFAHPDADHLEPDGTVAGAKLSVRFQRLGPRDYLLTSRSFHWVSEAPFNR